MWKILITKEAKKDLKKIISSHLAEKLTFLLRILQQDPFQHPPAYEKLQGKLNGFYSRRINIQHRLVYKIYPDQKTIQIVRLWTHYT